MQSRACYLLLYNVGRTFYVVTVADFRKFRFNYGKNETLLLRIKCNLSVSLLKAEVAMDSKLEVKIAAGILPLESEQTRPFRGAVSKFCST